MILVDRTAVRELCENLYCLLCDLIHLNFFPVAILCDKDIANGTSDTVGGCQKFSLKCIVHNNPIMDQRYLSMNFEV